MRRDRDVVFGTLLFILCLVVYGFDTDPWTKKPWVGVAVLTKQIGTFFAIAAIALAAMMVPYTRHALGYTGLVAGKMFDVPTRWFLAAAGLGMFFVTAYICYCHYGAIPHVADGQAQYIQSNIFTKGRITWPKHPLDDFFRMQYVLHKKHYVSSFPPGQAFLLYLGQLAGYPWLVNPAMAALFVVALYFLAKEVGNNRTARIAVLLSFASSFILFMSASFMVHPAALLMMTLFLLFYIRLYKYAGWQDGLFAGLALGALGIVRVQCALWIMFLFVPHALYLLYKFRQKYFRSLFLLGCGGAVFLALYMYFNWQATGHPLVTGYQTRRVRIATKFFAAYKGIKSSIREVAWDLNRLGLQISDVGSYLFGWRIHGLSFMLLLYAMCAQKKYVWLLMLAFFCSIVGLSLYNYIGITYGPRYFYEMCCVFLVLSALGIQRIAAVARSRFHLPFKRQQWRGLLCVIIVALSVDSLWGFNATLWRRYDFRYWEGNAGYYNDMMSMVKTPALVFIPNRDFFRYVAFTLPPDDSAPIIFALNLGVRNKELMDYYSTRNVYSEEGGYLFRIR